jgi:metal-dependent amidase/aminoacylase/carboxypeptidase family protein
VAVKSWLEQHGGSGTVRFYGCPGEEGGSGKTFMVREGLFDDVDAAVTWHPEAFAGMFNVSTWPIFRPPGVFTAWRRTRPTPSSGAQRAGCRDADDHRHQLP